MISLFSGLGGLDLGTEEAGFECLYASDVDPMATKSLLANQGFTLKSNRKFLGNAQIETCDIRDTLGKHLLNKLGKRRGEVDLLTGGPPCQSWSSAGRQRGFKDPRGQLLFEYLRMAEELDCRFLLFENVRGLLTARGDDGIPGSALARLRLELLMRGWQTSVQLLNAADYGVPQRRVRLFVLGYRSGDEPKLPNPSHKKADGWISLGEAICSLPPPTQDELMFPSDKLATELRLLPNGTGVKSPGKKETTRPGGHWGYKQGAFIANPDLPARTVTANLQQDWIRDKKYGIRRLTARECATLQSFPLGWAIVGARADQYRLIGNAVPPMLAEAVAYPLLDALASGEQMATPIYELKPLPAKLQECIKYTTREEERNGLSRRLAAPARRSRAA